MKTCMQSTLSIVVLGISVSSHAQSQADLAKQALNPVAALYSLPVQYNWNQKMGPSGEGTQSVINVQPVLPFSLNDEWNLISRSILPIIDQRGLVHGGQANKNGVGDINQSLFFSPKQPTESGWIWGAGPAFLLPTGSDPLLSGEQWGLGPAAVALKQASGWTIGMLGNHIWSLEKQPDHGKEMINQTFLQPFVSYTTQTYTSFGINTESTYDWEAKEWNVPVNLFVTQLFKIDNQPMSIQAGPRYWAESPENGSHGWGFRVAYTLLFPK